MIRVTLFCSLVAYFMFYYYRIKKQIHMLQLNSYMNDRYFLWIKRNKSKAAHIVDLIPLAFLPLIFFGLYKTGMILIILTYGIIFFFREKSIEKKRLVYTKRVNRLVFTLFLFYSLVIIALLIYLPWNENYQYIALIGLVLVILNYFVPLSIFLCNAINKPFEDAINVYYYKDAEKKLKDMDNLMVIGITGSYGKTSTKHIIQKILSKRFTVLMTPGSFNTTMGVVKTVREDLKPTHEIFIAEMGAKNIGDIAEICELVNPKYGVLTSVGPQHLETFKTIEKVKKAKLELIDSLPEDGIGFLNFDEDMLKELPELKCTVVGYGVDSDKATYKAENINFNSRGAKFTVVLPDGSKAEFSTKLLGKHNIYNILSAVAIATELGMDLDTIAYAVRDLEAVEHRLELKKMFGVTAIDDAYNSNPVGSKVALEVLSQMDGRKKILITPGMIELGEKEEELNKAFGSYAAKACDYVILVGKKQTKPILEGLLQNGFKEGNCFIAANLQEALQQLDIVKEEDCVVLFENDLTDDYNE